MDKNKDTKTQIELSWDLYRLSPDERRQQIVDITRHIATEDYEYPGNRLKKAVPLFKRPGVLNCIALQEDILRFATEYTDIMLFKDHLQLDPSLDNTRLMNLANTELRLWNKHLTDNLNQYPQQLIDYSQILQPQTDEERIRSGRRKMLGSIISLACTAKEHMNKVLRMSGDVPSSVDMENVTKQYMRYLQPVEQEYAPFNNNPSKKPIAEQVVAGYLAGLGKPDKNRSR